MIKREVCGYFKENPVYKYTVSNKKGMEFSCISHGAALTEIYVLDKNEEKVNVLLGFDKLDSYLGDTKMFAGAAIGRVAGRIDKGKFEIYGKKYKLEPNEGKNAHQGGKYGFNTLLWESEISEQDNSVTFYKTIEEGRGGFQGKLKTKIIYSLNDDNDLNIDFCGYSDVDTLFNPTVHSYFNLNGNLDNLLKNHTLKINADYVAKTREDNVPTGELKKVNETVFDFRKPRDLMNAINEVKKEFSVEGIDHPFKLNGKNAVSLASSDTGIKLDVESNRNSIIVYTLNFPCKDFMVNGKKIPQYGAVALEPQTLPDAINHSKFGDIILPANKEKSYSIKYHFGVIQ